MGRLHDVKPIDRWRAIVLYGRNVATYKIALANVLLDFAAKQTTTIDMPDLAAAFLDIYSRRLEQPRTQLNIPGRRTLMEKVVAGVAIGMLSRHQAIEIVAREGFNDVVPRFHTLPNEEPVERFYVYEDYRLRIDDSLIRLAQNAADDLVAELEGRWSLLETAFQPSYDASALWADVDTDAIYYGRSFERRSVCQARPVIAGYQNGLCFYCSDHLGLDVPHVDHLIPRSALAHDEIWNLVLAHESCNLSKSDNLPHKEYLHALYIRNEYYIASNHPIKQHLVAATGHTQTARSNFLDSAYDRAFALIPRIWRRNVPVTPQPLASLHLVR